MSDLTSKGLVVSRRDETLDDQLSALIENSAHIIQSHRLRRLLRAARRLNAHGLDPASILESALSELGEVEMAQTALSHDELLTLGGGEVLPLASEQEIADARAAQQNRYQQVLTEGLTAREVAEKLKLSDSKVQRLVDAGKLFVIGSNEECRFPSFQFTSEGILPHLDELLSATQGWHPLTIIRFFTVPDPDIQIGVDRAASVADWLAAGGDVAIVQALVEGR